MSDHLAAPQIELAREASGWRSGVTSPRSCKARMLTVTTTPALSCGDPSRHKARRTGKSSLRAAISPAILGPLMAHAHLGEVNDREDVSHKCGTEAAAI